MTRIPIPVNQLNRDTGVAPPELTVGDAERGHSLSNRNSRSFLEVVSSDDADQYVDLQLVAAEVDGVPIGPKRTPVPAGATLLLGFYPRNQYNPLVGAAAEATLTSDGTPPAPDETVTVDGVVYTFKVDAVGPTDIELGDVAATLAALAAAIDVAHPSVVIGGTEATTLRIVAKRTGDAGNLLAVSTSAAHLAWDGSTLQGGLDVGQHAYVTPSVSGTLGFRGYSI